MRKKPLAKMLTEASPLRHAKKAGPSAIDILACIPDAVYITDPFGKVLYVNQGFSDLTGYSAEEIIDQNVRILKSGRHPPEFYKTMWETIAGGKVWRGEIMNRTKDGMISTTELTITPLFGGDGGVQYYVAVQGDVTRYRQLLQEHTKRERELEDLQSQLATSERMYRSIFENSVDGIYQTTIDGKIITGNPALVKILGFNSIDDLQQFDLGTAVYLDPQDRKKFVTKLLAEGIFYAEELPLKRKDGSIILVQESARVVKDQAGNPLYFEGSLLDVTNKKTVERQLFQAQKMESIAKLAGVIAHDFNNLLTGIMGYGSLLMNKFGPAHDANPMLQQIMKTAERAGELTQKLLAFSRQAMLQPVPVNLSSIVRSLVPALERTIEKTVSIETQLDDSVPTVEADPAQVRQILLCLVQNASDALPEGGKVIIETGSVVLGTDFKKDRPWAREGRFVAIRVKDGGIGMDAATVKRAFEPFFTTKHDVPSRGLGLSMAYGIVKSHNGMLDVASEVGKGTTVSVLLPITERKPVVPPTPPAQAWTADRNLVLLVDDEAILRELGETALTLAGYRVLCAADGYEALDIYALHAHEIGLVVLDLTMPGKTGGEVLTEMLTRYTDCRILLSSGYSLDASIKSLLDKGALGFLQKPYRSQQLVERVEQLIKGPTPC